MCGSQQFNVRVNHDLCRPQTISRPQKTRPQAISRPQKTYSKRHDQKMVTLNTKMAIQFNSVHETARDGTRPWSLRL